MVISLIGMLLSISALISTGALFSTWAQDSNTTSTVPKSTEFFYFDYQKTGGIAGQTEKISYSSASNQLTISDRDNKTTNKTLSAEEEKMVKEAIENSGFFEAAAVYPPPDGADIIWHSLSSIIGDMISTELPKENSVTWTDISKGVPSGLEDAAAAIERAAYS